MDEILVEFFRDERGQRPYHDWLRGLRDKTTIARIQGRLNRVRAGNLGDVKAIDEQLSELRLAFGPGYRIYFMRPEPSLIVILCAGDKDSQQRDIRRATELVQRYEQLVETSNPRLS
jgi:putative addiction module killer protein